MTDSGAPGHSLAMVPAALPERNPEHGSAPAFDEVYERNFEFVWRSLRRLGVASSALDDAAQEVFLVVHRRLPEFAAQSSLKTWLFGIVLHVAQRAARTAARRRTAELPEHELVARGGTPQDEVQRREAIKLLYSLLEQLDADKRAVFVMAELEQMTAPEMAEVLGAPLNTVYSRLRAARRDFEAALKRWRARPGWSGT